MDMNPYWRAAALALVMTLSACGVTEPEGRMVFRGVVVAKTATSGFAAGDPLPGATIMLTRVPPLDLTPIFIDATETGADGTFEISVGPPPGEDEPHCSTLRITTRRSGFFSNTLRLAGVCEGPGTVDGLRIEMDPITTP